MAQPLAGTDSATFPFWSPDSTSIGFFSGGQLKRLDLGGGPPQALASAAGARGGAWNAEGVIVFAPTSASALLRVAARGGQPVAVTTLAKQTSHRFPRFLPGGRQFLFFAMGTPEIQGIYLASMDAPDTQRLTAADTAGAWLAPGPPADASREGGWLVWIQVAYTSGESGRDEVYVRPFVEGGSGAGGGQWQVSTAGGYSPVWRPDGTELYYLAPDSQMLAARISVRGADLEPGAPVALFPARIVGGSVDTGIGRQYDVARDGRFLINTVLEDASASPITILQNWQPPPTAEP
jgi:Tol biopolymer transport system component